MTAPRPVEPVVGMEFYEYHDAEPCKVTRVTEADVVYSVPRQRARWLMLRFSWLREQEARIIRPVLWTVGPSERRGTRLRDGGIPVTCSADSGGPAKCERCRELLSLYPTRAAALAAGKAHGWSEPVARRVVRR